MGYIDREVATEDVNTTEADLAGEFKFYAIGDYGEEA